VIVGTWNLENLFRPGADTGPSDEQAYNAKLTELARVIGEIGADIVAVQEVGDPEALEDLGARLAGDWLAESSELPDGRGIRVGFLSRLGLGDVERVGEFPDLAPVQVDDQGTTMAEMRRGALRVRVRVDGRDIDLVTCHLKSKLLTFRGGRHSPRDEGERARFAGYALYRRAAEAVTQRAFANRLLDGQGNDRALIVLGDLNDEPTAATTQILLGPPGSEVGTPGFERPDYGDGSRHGTSRRGSPRGVASAACSAAAAS
jgi:endonuclease/exonuclease/phosphatase family metal-dependent hydrolase